LALARKDELEELKHLVKECPHCQGVVLEVAIKCRHCGKVVYDLQRSQVSSEKSQRTEKKNFMSRSLSALAQLVGLVLIVLGLMGLETIYWPLILFPLGIVLWMIGAIGVRWKKCSNCGCTIANKNISKCPRCYFEFSTS
jgi:predicted Zn-ribbon and HTH transcriptional regulator